MKKNLLFLHRLIKQLILVDLILILKNINLSFNTTLFNFKYSNDGQFWKILLSVNGLCDVIKLDKSKDFNDVQSLNIAAM